jgi:glutathione synthase/RimK-type ligase-like ATP-grasp enzyme
MANFRKEKKIALHVSELGFYNSWRSYCEKENIAFKTVNCYANDIIHQLKGCDALMWHHSQGNAKDLVIAKQILFALEHTGFKVFPNFKTNWHFDDKAGQKYLLERAGAALVPSNVFYDKLEALAWAEKSNFPKVFKLRGGAGSSNVKLANSKSEARSLINKAFGNGFANYDAYGSLKERFRKWRLGKTNAVDVLKGLVRFIHPPQSSKVAGRQVGYAYFQDFIPNNNSDTRIIVIGDKAFALKRYTRKGDFRASGSGDFGYDKELFDERCVRIAFDLTRKLALQVGAFDFVFDEENRPLVVEVSYGYVMEVYYPCPGYWDNDLHWHTGQFNHEGWMVDELVKSIDSTSE